MAKAKMHPTSSRNRKDGNRAASNDQAHAAAAAAPGKNEEGRRLLAAHASDDDEDDVDDDDDNDGGDGRVVHGGDARASPTSVSTSTSTATSPVPGLMAAFSPSRSRSGRAGPNRVRFDLRPTSIPPPARRNSYADGRRRSSEDDFDLDLDLEDPDAVGGRDATLRQRLLTEIEAPAVALSHELARGELARPRSGMSSAFMNMANSIIGAGIIGQPYAFRQAGLLAGVVLLVGLTVIVDWTIRLIVVNSKMSGAGSFQGTVEHCFGRGGLVAISVTQWAFAFGGMVAFGVIVGDSIPHVLEAIWPGLREVPVLGWLAHRQVVIVVFILAISFPLTLYRDIAKLAKASTAALISMIVIIGTVVIQSMLAPQQDRGSFSTRLLTVNDGMFQAIGVISFAFVCHHNSLLIYGSLHTPTMDRFARVTHYSAGVSMLACMLMALAGFLVFADKTQGNVLNNFPRDNTMVNVARLCFGLNMLTTLPLEAFVCREVMVNYFFPGEPFSMTTHLIFSSTLVLGAMTVSLITCDLGVVFELVGATSACALAYILPPLCYIKLSSRSWRTHLAWAVVLFGCTVMGISVLQAVAKLVRGGGETVQCM